MPEITSIPKVSLDLANKAAEAPVQESSHSPVPQVQPVSSKEPAVTEKVTRAKETAQPEKARSDLPIKGMEDVRLKYQVNPETKELTLLIIDRATKEVIRTIPSDELKKFKKGDLLELSS